MPKIKSAAVNQSTAGRNGMPSTQLLRLLQLTMPSAPSRFLKNSPSGLPGKGVSKLVTRERIGRKYSCGLSVKARRMGTAVTVPTSRKRAIMLKNTLTLDFCSLCKSHMISTTNTTSGKTRNTLFVSNPNPPSKAAMRMSLFRSRRSPRIK